MDLRVGRRAGDRTHRLFSLPQGAAAPVSAVAERRFPNIRYWNEPGKGGHFAAFEQPALFVDEVRSFFRLVR
jgi:pimeloyl-ACP methyl ester carboxylesterase